MYCSTHHVICDKKKEKVKIPLMESIKYAATQMVKGGQCVKVKELQIPTLKCHLKLNTIIYIPSLIG
jgi:hypothetical protein